jgi:uncharacterized protein
MRWYDAVWVGLAVTVGAYVLVAVAIMLLQRRLIYQPDARRTTPDAEGLADVEAWRIPTGDNQTLVAWYCKAQPGYPTFVYFHGNAGWIELRTERLTELARRGFGVLMPSYRGYGGSTGQPTEAANVADAKTVYDALRASGVSARDIIVFGESLGTGIATQLAASKVVAGLVLDSPYSSMADLAQRNYPWLPVRYLLWDHYETIRHIKRVTIPVLVLHGDADGLVPVSMGIAVYRAAISPKMLQIYPGAPHLDHRQQGSFDDVQAWIEQIAYGVKAEYQKKKAQSDTPGFSQT